MPLLTFIAISGVSQSLGVLLTKSDVYYYCVGLSRSHLFWFYSSQRGPAHHGPQCTGWMDTALDWTGFGKIRNVPRDNYPGDKTS